MSHRRLRSYGRSHKSEGKIGTDFEDGRERGGIGREEETDEAGNLGGRSVLKGNSGRRRGGRGWEEGDSAERGGVEGGAEADGHYGVDAAPMPEGVGGSEGEAVVVGRVGEGMKLGAERARHLLARLLVGAGECHFEADLAERRHNGAPEGRRGVAAHEDTQLGVA